MNQDLNIPRRSEQTLQYRRTVMKELELQLLKVDYNFLSFFIPPGCLNKLNWKNLLLNQNIVHKENLILRIDHPLFFEKRSRNLAKKFVANLRRLFPKLELGDFWAQLGQAKFYSVEHNLNKFKTCY